MSNKAGSRVVYAVTAPQFTMLRGLSVVGPRHPPAEGEMPEAMRDRLLKTLDGLRAKGLAAPGTDGWAVTMLGAALVQHLATSTIAADGESSS